MVRSVLVGKFWSFSRRLDVNFRRVFRLRSNQLRDAGDAPAAPQDEEGGGEEGEAGEEQREERCQEEGGQTDADDDCHVCPGTEAPPPLLRTRRQVRCQRCPSV